ncbi:hypothetical protein AURDEDRAFT_116720 [Auricularia subglabra TFB-10046 SS5]|uniref:Peptidase A1 domain-containing protein n=1 Tax=Auricularia subglabra (strain TFB-10046 / SS5) TaxID=717982 RepID=J0WUJ2_AURST|nr:hypothetical protein AURDEDRAFT_116720 [Auricularia subglabra TFB-10046 SS5]
MATGGVFTDVKPLAETSRGPTPIRAVMEDPEADDLSFWDAPRKSERGRRGRPDKLGNAQRTINMVPVHQTAEFKSRSHTYVGYAIVVHLLAPSNLEEHERDLEKWDGTYVRCEDLNQDPLEFQLLLDLGAPMDSWVFCELSWDTITPLKGSRDIPWSDFHEHRYANKNKIPLPPDSHVRDRQNMARFAYGSDEFTSKIAIAQTVVKIRYHDRDHHPVDLPEFPIGVALGFTPTDIERDEDGVLSLARQSNSKSTFEPQTSIAGPRWTSKTFTGMLKEKNIISKNTFTLYIDHPIFVPQAKSVVIFGPVYDPGLPSIVADEERWTSVPVLYGSGQWELHLKMIKFWPAKGRYKEIPVGVDVTLDNGSSQTYLSKTIVDDLTEKLDIQNNVAPSLAREDELVLVFSQGESEIAIHGQARRFFTSPYLKSSGERAFPFAPTFKKRYILGLNFFMTFITTFQDADDPMARILVHPHDFV